MPDGHAGGTAAGRPSDLARDLAAVCRDVRFDEGTRALFSTDASNYREVPIGVVFPRSREEVLAALDVCRAHAAPVLPRGAGTSLAGQCCNTAVVLDVSRHLTKIVEVDPARRIARVEPGVVLDDLRREAERHGLTFGPDPATHRTCTLGGMIGNNSCGVHSMMSGRTDENVESLEVVTPDGVRLSVGKTPPEALARIVAAGGRPAEIHRGLASLAARHAAAIRTRFPAIPRRVSGYNLPALLPENGFDVARALVGSEGTCVFVLEATVRLVPSPRFRCLLVLGFPDVYAAADRVPEILRHRPIGFEGLDDGLVEDMRRASLHLDSLALLPSGGGWLLVEFGGDTPGEAADRAHALTSALAAGGFPPSARLCESPEEQRRMWRTREAALGATSHAPGRPLTWEGWEDSAVHPERLGPYLRDLRALLTRHGYGGDFYGHFGQGCVHTRTDFDLASEEGIWKYRRFVFEAADLVISYGGSLSGEHGDGQSRGELLPRMFGEELVGAFREFKRIWDPEGRMNPGKKIDARPLDRNLRLAPSDGSAPLPTESTRATARTRTEFAYATDGGDFSRALLRCVGVGLCRREDGATMCPSWRATKEEAHSTRGRARLLSEMLRGETVRGGWRDENVREALDLCLACKGCKGDCPAEVDMATYKSEFLFHYYEGRLRPRSAYAMGLVHLWVPLAEKAPGVVNFLTHAPGISRAFKWLAGIAPDRDIPRLASTSFRESFRSPDHPITPSPDPARGRVILWADTFSNAFRPDALHAAADVLAAAGFRVSIPADRLCCGRPLYDHGMLGLARELLSNILESLRAEIRAGTPVVALEPSCGAVLRDELPALFPEDPDARRLASQTFFFAEFLGRFAPGFPGAGAPAAARGPTVIQGHCHQGALAAGSLEAERALLARLGFDAALLDSGCCGMAGAFGLEREHAAISGEIARLGLLPLLAVAPDAAVVADGFSCREQILQRTGRRAVHVAELVHAALRHGLEQPEKPNGSDRSTVLG